MAKATLDYKKMTIDDIIGWCLENNKMGWLEKNMNQTVSYDVYPRVKVQKLDENGNPVFNKKTGKPKMVSVADKTQKPKTEQRPIGFVQLKNMFVKTYMPEIMPKKKRPLTMKEKLEAAKGN